MNRINTRLQRLEGKANGSGQMYVVAGPDGFDAESYLRSQGHVPGRRDLIVEIRKFGTYAHRGPITVHALG